MESPRDLSSINPLIIPPKIRSWCYPSRVEGVAYPAGARSAVNRFAGHDLADGCHPSRRLGTSREGSAPRRPASPRHAPPRPAPARHRAARAPADLRNKEARRDARCSRSEARKDSARSRRLWILMRLFCLIRQLGEEGAGDGDGARSPGPPRNKTNAAGGRGGGGAGSHTL